MVLRATLRVGTACLALPFPDCSLSLKSLQRPLVQTFSSTGKRRAARGDHCQKGSHRTQKQRTKIKCLLTNLLRFPRLEVGQIFAVNLVFLGEFDQLLALCGAGNPMELSFSKIVTVVLFLIFQCGREVVVHEFIDALCAPTFLEGDALLEILGFHHKFTIFQFLQSNHVWNSCYSRVPDITVLLLLLSWLAVISKGIQRRPCLHTQCAFGMSTTRPTATTSSSWSGTTTLAAPPARFFYETIQ